jgi:hypothetical protein
MSKAIKTTGGIGDVKSTVQKNRLSGKANSFPFVGKAPDHLSSLDVDGLNALFVVKDYVSGYIRHISTASFIRVMFL